MKIKLKKGKQTKLILLAKDGLTWKQLAEILEMSEAYLSGDIRKENILISEKIYKCLWIFSGLRTTNAKKVSNFTRIRKKLIYI